MRPKSRSTSALREQKSSCSISAVPRPVFRRPRRALALPIPDSEKQRYPVKGITWEGLRVLRALQRPSLLGRGRVILENRPVLHCEATGRESCVVVVPGLRLSQCQGQRGSVDHESGGAG